MEISHNIQVVCCCIFIVEEYDIYLLDVDMNFLRKDIIVHLIVVMKKELCSWK